MSAVPIIINGVFMPSNKKDPPVKGQFIGYASIAGLEVGGGPIIPDTPPEVPTEPPEEQPQPGIAVVIKPAPVTGGWGLAADNKTLQWYYVPGQSGAGPKR